MSTLTKLLLATTLLIVMVFVTFMLLRLNGGGEDVSNVPDATFPVSGGTSGDSTTVDVPDERNPEVPVLPLPREELVDLGGGSYIVAGGNSQTERPRYQILYYEPDGSYTISLLSFPLSRARKDAESELMGILKLSEAQMCSQKIMVTVPFHVEARYSGRDLLMSFCPGAVTLP